MGTQLPHLLDSLGWALLHSLWQGTLAFLALLLLRSFTKDKASALRVSLGLLALLISFVAFVVTFAIYMNGSIGSGGMGTDINALISVRPPQEVALTTGGSVSALGVFGIYTPVLGLIWCLGFAGLSLRYIVSFNMTQRLRKTGLSAVPDMWTRRFRTLARNSGVYKHVELYISSHVSGPLTLGFFKPVVLVPASFLTQLPADQIEAVLLHEIAHIRRHDYLINLLQTAIKTVFFFHPAIHLISRRIDLDREHACDDYAVAQSRDAQALAKGLAALRLSLSPRPFTMAANRKDMPLLERLKRLAGSGATQDKPGQALMPFLTLFIFAAVLAVAMPLTHSAEAGETDSEAHPEPSMHANASQKNYRFETRKIGDHEVTVKVVKNGSRWVKVGTSWYNADKSPEALESILSQTSGKPKPPVMPAVNSGDKWNQYKVDKDYFEADMKRYKKSLAAQKHSDPVIKAKFEQNWTQTEIERETEREVDKTNRQAESAKLSVKLNVQIVKQSAPWKRPHAKLRGPKRTKRAKLNR